MYKGILQLLAAYHLLELDHAARNHAHRAIGSTLLETQIVYLRSNNLCLGAGQHFCAGHFAAWPLDWRSVDGRHAAGGDLREFDLRPVGFKLIWTWVA